MNNNFLCARIEALKLTAVQDRAGYYRVCH